MCLCSFVSWMSPTSIHLLVCDDRLFWVFVRSTTANVLTVLWQLVQVCPGWHLVEQKRLYFLQEHAFLALQWFWPWQLTCCVVALSFPPPPVSVLHPVYPCVLPFVPLFVPDRVSSVSTVETKELVGLPLNLLVLDGDGCLEWLLIALIGNLLTSRFKHLSSNLGKSCSGLLYPCD